MQGFLTQQISALIFNYININSYKIFSTNVLAFKILATIKYTTANIFTYLAPVPTLSPNSKCCRSDFNEP